ncbi:uncharacterized protein PODANS_5_10200 [Podospora anserina S mat+]|uniref:Podospora anserina S mat+ genomic DNA chromosome 5, supercontig 9 n=1 Tax=Podospora anserina (strain S / ATCC MYA-4624 / DSM 980 / FGSC 10383) TaxID=515849 RepID=B2ALB8_PODAN|nr:uncharacterized protein PODANS_5_10200 [Podospora anserina S mat+]CAP64756.1 unnamed protein product [Podospora anserina S mat+]CDP30157.1 Putative protein of unknown function [Podospora anserina S mat+]
MKEFDQSRFDTLQRWAQDHGAALHPSLEVYEDDVTGYSLRVKPSASEALAPGFCAVTCHVAITLSYINALIDGPISRAPQNKEQRPAFPPQFMSSNPPHVIGRFFLVKEYLKEKDSYWWPYISTLPQPDRVDTWALPAVWPEDDIECLEETNAHVAVREIQANIKKEYKHARKLLKEVDFPGWQEYTQLLYKWAFCIFTSRSFRPSLILSQETQDHVLGLTPHGTKVDDFSILQPLLDIGNHDPTSQYQWNLEVDGTCQLICNNAYQPGQQVFNNYGLKSNSELLLGYGFILPVTDTLHNDYVHVKSRRPPSTLQKNELQDFLISLRPFSDPSSVAGRLRVFSQQDTRLNSLPGLSRIEPGLIRDLASAVATSAGELAALQHWAQGTEESIPTELHELLERIQQTIGAKVQFDYQRFKSIEIESADNQNQELAVRYRNQYEPVLEAAMDELSRALVPNHLAKLVKGEQ